MKKLWFVAASVIFLVLYLNFDSLAERLFKDIMGVEVLPMEKIEELCKGKEDAFPEQEITLNGGKIPYDSEQNMLLIPQSLAEESFDGRLQAKDGRLYFLEDEAFKDKEEAISQNQVFRLFWVKDNQCWMYNVYFTGMPVINITTESQTDKERYGLIEVYDQYRGSARYQSGECSFHLRGATSFTYEKSSYKLTLTDEKLSLLGMRKDDDWILNALYDDEGLIHNKLSYEVWQEIAASNRVENDEGISMEYAELFLDNEYLGIYGLMERVDKRALSLNNKDILYKCRDQVNPGEDDFYSELTEEMEPVFELKYPETFTMEDWEPLKSWASMFLEEASYDYEAGKAILNMENAIDYNLFNLLICGMDNTMKNVYFLADYQGDGSYRFIKIPWDLNMTWGNSWIDDYNCNFNRYQEKNIDSTGGFTADIYELYLRNPEEIGGMLKKRWLELRESIITKEALYEKADAEHAYLQASGAYVRNRQKWPPKGEYWQDSYLYDYINKRIDFLDSYIGQMG